MPLRGIASLSTAQPEQVLPDHRHPAHRQWLSGARLESVVASADVSRPRPSA